MRIPSHYSHCVGCGEDAPGGLRLHTIAGEGLSVRGELVVSQIHQGAPGLIHGGVLSTAMDEVLGGLSYLLMVPAVTGRLQVDFLKPIRVGATIVIDAHVLGQKGRRVYTRAVAHLADDDSGEPVAYGSAIFVQVEMRHFYDNGNPEQVSAALGEPRSEFAAWRVNP